MLRMLPPIRLYSESRNTDKTRIKSIEQEIEGLQGSSTRSHGRR